LVLVIDQPHGVRKQPYILAAVGNFEQCAKARLSKLMEMSKTISCKVYTPDRILICLEKKLWPIHVPAAAVIHE